MDDWDEVRGLKANRPLAYRTIEALTTSLRERFGWLKSTKITGAELVRAIESGVKIGSKKYGVDFRVDIAVLDAAELNGAPGRALYNDEDVQLEIMISDEVYRGILRNNPVDVFTFAHEIAHVWLHHDMLFERAARRKARVSRDSDIDEYSVNPVYVDTEWQANSFAGSLLMPGWLIAELEIESPRVLSLVCGTSEAASVKRLDIFRAFENEILAGWRWALQRLTGNARLELDALEL